ncbi:glycine cleavage system protein GcvH [Dethiothermospora halolimnae]|uniref:glycine cleavage system protein GcvH n=1 Tax=Dethiothermospora halolimnae TaxID=3114390 RepID=UPI003CCBB374
MKILKGLLYTKDHEWIKVEGDNAYIGITDFAQNSLGDIVFVDLPEEDDEFDREEEYGVIESVKAASDSFMPIGGTVLEVNQDVLDSPEAINADPYGNWFMLIKISDKSQLDDLMSPEEYEDFCEKER